jgi:hypothetical protein
MLLVVIGFVGKYVAAWTDRKVLIFLFFEEDVGS